MINSMTGYGQATIWNDNRKIDVEIRSVNHRFCEMTVRMPRQLLHLEDSIKKIAQRALSRGKIDIFITMEGREMVKRTLEVDWDLLRQFLLIANKMETEHHITDKGLLSSLLLHEQIVSIKEEQPTIDDLVDAILEAVGQATEKLVIMRQREGTSLTSDFFARLEGMKKTIEQLKEYAPNVQENYRIRLMKRVTELSTGTISIDEGRLLTEVALFADKSNIDEELTRLSSHIAQFFTIVKEGGTVGKKLDFLVQEMNRETNTIGSKANDIHISKHVVELKSEIEKLKEQVQNVE